MSVAVRRKIEDLLEEAALLPVGPQERALLDEAVRLADEAGEEELAYKARMYLTPSAHMTGDTDAMLAAFGWCVGKHDSDPVRFPVDPGVHVDLLFQYKWMALQLASNSRFPRERVEAVHADMERRYREAGVGQTGVLQSKHDVAVLMGDLEAAQRYVVERDALERDDYSHCEACVRSNDASFAQLRGDDAEAIRLWEEILEEDLSCGEEPEYAESDILLALLRAGRYDDALAAHTRSYRRARTNPDAFPMIANHLVFCAVTGNLSRGLQILERHLALLAHDPYDEASHFSGLAAVALLLDGVVEAGQGATRIRDSDHPTLDPLLGPAAADRTAEELRDAAWSAAAGIGRRFDERNGNDWYGRRLEARRALREVRYDVPLGGEIFEPQPVAASEPDDAPGWLARAQTRLYAADPEGVRDAVSRGLALGDAAAAPALHKTLVWLGLQNDDPDAARRHHADRIAALRQAGWTDQADLEERVGLKLLGHGTPEDIPALTAELDAARERSVDPSAVADLLVTIASCHLRADRPEEAAQLLDDAATLLPADDPQYLRRSLDELRLQALVATERIEEATALSQEILDDPRNAGWPLLASLRLRAQLLAGSGALDEALPVAERLLAEVAAIDSAVLVAQAAQLTGMILGGLERYEEAVARLELALRRAERAEQPTIGLRFSLARIQLDAGLTAPALENFETVYLDEKAAGAPPAAIAETGLHLGRAARAADEPELAYHSLAEAVDLAEQGEAHALAAEAGASLGDLMLQFESLTPVDVFERALSNARRAEQFDGVAHILHGLGRARLRADDDTGLADLDRAIAEARGAEAHWYAANVLDTKGRVLVDLGRLDEGVETLLNAADALAAEGDAMTAASGEVYAARALAAAERADAAVAILGSARDRVPPGSPPHTGITLELADLLDGLGRSAEASALRDAVA